MIQLLTVLSFDIIGSNKFWKMIPKENLQCFLYLDTFLLQILYYVLIFSDYTMVTGSIDLYGSTNGKSISFSILYFTLDTPDINLAEMQSLHYSSNLYTNSVLVAWVQYNICPSSSLIFSVNEPALRLNWLLFSPWRLWFWLSHQPLALPRTAPHLRPLTFPSVFAESSRFIMHP